MLLNVKESNIVKKRMDCSPEYVDGYHFEEKIKSADIVACHSFKVGCLIDTRQQIANLHLDERDHLYVVNQEVNKPTKVENKTKISFLKEYGLNPVIRLQRARERNLILRIRRNEKKALRLREDKKAKKERKQAEMREHEEWERRMKLEEKALLKAEIEENKKLTARKQKQLELLGTLEACETNKGRYEIRICQQELIIEKNVLKLGQWWRFFCKGRIRARLWDAIEERDNLVYLKDRLQDGIDDLKASLEAINH